MRICPRGKRISLGTYVKRKSTAVFMLRLETRAWIALVKIPWPHSMRFGPPVVEPALVKTYQMYSMFWIRPLERKI